MITKKAILAKQKAISALAKKSGISYLALFGSVARDEQTNTSDVDILIKFARNNKSYFDLIELEHQLACLFKTKVSVQTKGTISPLIYPYIQSDITPIYGQE